jgi:hypothetical protein
MCSPAMIAITPCAETPITAGKETGSTTARHSDASTCTCGCPSAISAVCRANKGMRPWVSSAQAKEVLSSV